MERVQGEVGHRASVVEFQEWKLNWISDFACGRGVDCRGDRPLWRLRGSTEITCT